MKKLSVALVGCSIGRSHIEEGYLLNSDRFDLRVVYDLNPEKSCKIADEFGKTATAQSVDPLPVMTEIDVIDICTPPQRHLPMIIKALSTTDARRAPELVTAFHQSAWNGIGVGLPVSPEHETYRNWVPAHFRTPMEVHNVSHS